MREAPFNRCKQTRLKALLEFDQNGRLVTVLPVVQTDQELETLSKVLLPLTKEAWLKNGKNVQPQDE